MANDRDKDELIASLRTRNKDLARINSKLEAENARLLTLLNNPKGRLMNDIEAEALAAEGE